MDDDDDDVEEKIAHAATMLTQYAESLTLTSEHTSEEVAWALLRVFEKFAAVSGDSDLLADALEEVAKGLR